MGLINVPEIQNNDEANEELFNSRFATIVNVINGNLDADNLADGAVTAAKLANGAVTANKVADGALTLTKTDGKLGFAEIGRTSLNSASDTITVQDLPVYKYLHVLIHVTASSGTVDASLRFNNDSGTNYGMRYSVQHGGTTTSLSATSIPGESGNIPTGLTGFYILDIVNVATKPKIYHFIGESEPSSGAANAPNHLDLTGKWQNTSNAITRIDFINGGTGDFAADSEIVVYGRN